MREILRLMVVLVGICAASAGVLSWARTSLAARIEMQSDFYVRGPALERLFERPAAELLADKVTVEVDGVDYPIFYVRDGEEVVGLAVEAPGHGGYAGDIVMMIGVNKARGEMLGVEIVSHGETPGLGARVAEESFREQWRGLPAMRPASLKGDGGAVDAITGATFSSRAMIDGTNQVVALVRDHEDEILASIAAAEAAVAEEAE